MAGEDIERRLAAIMSADVAGYFKRAIADGHGQHDLPATFEILLKQSA